MKESIWKVMRRREAGLVGFIILAALSVGLMDSAFLSWANWKDILVRCAPTAIVCCGVCLVVLTGEIDISTGSMMALLAAVMGNLMSSDHLGWHPVIGIPVVLLCGTLLGFFTGVLVTVGKVPSIIVTLGWLTCYRGLTTLIMRGENIGNLPRFMSEASKTGLVGIPLSVWAALAVICCTAIVLRLTPLGWRIRAAGSSGYAAEMTGLDSDRIRILVFGWTGFLVAVATLVDVPRLPRIESGIGNGFELLVVTCVVVGGVSISGGRGQLRGVLLAVVLMTMIRPMLTFMNIGEAGEKWTRAIQGLFILLAVILDQLSNRQTNTKSERSAKA